MRYLGGKSRLAKKFAPILDAALLERDGNFVEPFVGGFNIIPALSRVREALCCDIHEGLIGMYQALQNGWEPPENISEEEYQVAKERRATDPRSVFMSFASSYGGKEWGGYARGEGRNWTDESRRSLLHKATHFEGVEFRSFRFEDLPKTAPAVYYCDPPYRGTTKYKTGNFCHETFDLWCENRVAVGHIVFVSEFDAPSHWSAVWEHVRRETTAKHNRRSVTDRLYRVVPR